MRESQETPREDLDIFIYIYHFLSFFTGCAGSLLLRRLCLSLWHSEDALQLWFAGFSLWYTVLLQSSDSRHMGSVAVFPRLESIGSVVVAHLSMCDLPGSGIEPVSPALVGVVFTTELPGDPRP